MQTLSANQEAPNESGIHLSLLAECIRGQSLGCEESVSALVWRVRCGFQSEGSAATMKPAVTNMSSARCAAAAACILGSIGMTSAFAGAKLVCKAVCGVLCIQSSSTKRSLSPAVSHQRNLSKQHCSLYTMYTCTTAPAARASVLSLVYTYCHDSAWRAVPEGGTSKPAAGHVYPDGGANSRRVDSTTLSTCWQMLRMLSSVQQS